MQSCIYEGWVRHRRRTPVEHQFRNKLFMVYLDLGEMDTVFDGYWLWSTKRMAIAQFRRSDHFGDPAISLDDTVRDFVERSGYPRPEGPIRLLTHLRYFGCVFNPVSFFYCFSEIGSLEYVVAEVTSTPWGERHCYVVARSQFEPSDDFPTSSKCMHVSPFMPMNIDYSWQMTSPRDQLTVRIANHRSDEDQETSAMFDATLQLEKREISSWQLAKMLALYPIMTAQIFVNIYWQALRLWIQGCPAYSHPRKTLCPKHRPNANQTQNIKSDSLENTEV